MDSLLEQTFTDFEVILIDDGSSDDSGALCDEYAFHHTRVRVIHQANSGVSTARNRGIEAACGEFIAFVDADDWVEPTFLQAFAEEVEQHPEVDGIVQGFWDHEGKEVKWPSAYHASLQDFAPHLYEMEQAGLIGYVWNKLFRRAVLLEHNIAFDLNIPIGEDYLFVLSFIIHGNRFAVLPNVGYHYIYSGHKEYAFQTLNSRLDAFEALLSHTDALPIDTVHQLRSKEFWLALYTLHKLYRGHHPRSTRLDYLRKIRSRAQNNPAIRIRHMHYPYSCLGALVLHAPLPLCDLLFQMRYAL